MLPCPLASKKRAPGTQVSGRHRTWEHRPPWPLGNRNPVENVVGLCQCLAASGQSQEILQPQAVGSFWLKRRGDGKTRARGLGGPHPEGCMEIAWPDPGGLWGQRSFRKMPFLSFRHFCTGQAKQQDSPTSHSGCLQNGIS